MENVMAERRVDGKWVTMPLSHLVELAQKTMGAEWYYDDMLSPELDPADVPDGIWVSHNFYGEYTADGNHRIAGMFKWCETNGCDPEDVEVDVWISIGVPPDLAAPRADEVGYDSLWYVNESGRGAYRSTSARGRARMDRMEDVMRFPTIADVSAELRQINKQQLEPDDADEGIDVRLQVYPDGEWAVHSGSADYDQDHRGYWGSSGVPGNNRRFDSKDIARDLIDQAREHKATGGSDDDGMSESPQRVASRKQPSLPGYEDVPEKIEIQIPNMPVWEQVDGDMSPDKYGGTIARSDGDYLELLKIQPVREYVGDDDAAEVGFPFWTREASFDASDLDPTRDEVRKALGSIDMRMDDLEDLTPKQQALTIACALLDYGNAEEGPAGWSKDILHDKVKWSSGKIAGPEYLEDEDEEFRREILGEEDEEDEEDDEEVDEEDLDEEEYE